jgi:adenine phosphoribosyltransferase
MEANKEIIKELKEAIRDIPDFPKKGILFKDITTILKDAENFKKSVDILASRYENKKIDKVICIESRGFIFGAALAYKLNAGVIMVRKEGKLPHDTYSVTYDLEYGTDTLEMHKDSVEKDDNVLVVDDLLATGGTAKAVCDLLKKRDVNIVELCFLVELVSLKGREKLQEEYPVFSLIKF